MVNLSVAGNEPNDPDAVSYSWSAPAGIILADANTATPSFVSPIVLPSGPAQIIPLQLTVTDDDGDQITRTVNVTVNPSEFDFSDAPLNFGTATHVVDPGVLLGTLNDIDPGNLESANADADGAEDDGITIPALTQRQKVTLTADATGAGGFLQGWIDFDGSNTFDADEQVVTDLQDGGAGDLNVAAGTIAFEVFVPADAATTQTFARFRWSTQAGLDTITNASDGEVEDYAVTIAERAAGVPIPSNPTEQCTVNWFRWQTARVASRAATALNPMTHGFAPIDTILGANTWYEQTLPFVPGPAMTPADMIPNQQLGRPSVDLLEENTARARTARSGEAFYGVFRFELEPNVQTILPLDDAAFVDGHAFLAVDSSGMALARFPSVDTFNAGQPYVASNSQGTPEVGSVAQPSAWSDNTFVVDVPSDGLVFVHYVLVDEGAQHRPALRYCPQDFGDAPATYGAPGHVYERDFLLGSAKDIDVNLVGDNTAMVDDSDGNGDNDEDGVTIPALTQGQTATITAEVTGAGGFLQGWIDFNGNDVFDAGEQVATNLQDGGAGDTSTDAGTIAFDVAVPADAVTTQTFARFRWSSVSGLNAIDAAIDGEVEDYAVTVAQKSAFVDQCYVQADWTSATQATFTRTDGSTVGITLSGTAAPTVLANQSHNPFWDNASAYSPPRSDTVRSAPQISAAGTIVVTFSEAVENPVMNFWSLGNGGAGRPTATFDRTATIIRATTLDQVSSTAVRAPANSGGVGGNGSVKVDGVLTSFTTTIDQAEFWWGTSFALLDSTINPALCVGSATAPSATISGYVFADANFNDTFDSGEADFSQITVSAFSAGPDNTFGTPDDVEVASGETGSPYELQVPPGTYELRVDSLDAQLPANSRPSITTRRTVTVAAGDVITDQNFGVAPEIIAEPVPPASRHPFCVATTNWRQLPYEIDGFSSIDGLTANVAIQAGTQVFWEETGRDNNSGDIFDDVEHTTILPNLDGTNIIYNPGPIMGLDQTFTQTFVGRQVYEIFVHFNSIDQVQFLFEEAQNPGIGWQLVSRNEDLANISAGQGFSFVDMLEGDQDMSRANEAAGGDDGLSADGTVRFYSLTEEPIERLIWRFVEDPINRDLFERIQWGTEVCMPIDFSDAPTTGTNYGAPSHGVVTGVRLGTLLTPDVAAFDSANASGDDDDGVTPPALTAGVATTIPVAVSGTGGFLQAWFDWNNDGDFNDPGEQVATDVQDTAGTGTINLSVTPPADAAVGSTFARFRWSTMDGLDPIEAAPDGEVEGYPVTVAVPAIDAVTDDFSASPIASNIGGTTATVFTNDRILGAPFNPGDVTVSVEAVNNPSGSPSGQTFTINTDGEISVPRGTPAGTYVVVYEICDLNTPANCDTAEATILVDAPSILAMDDDFTGTPINGADGGSTTTVFVNDTLNSATATASNVEVSVLVVNDSASVATTLTFGIDADGIISVPADTPAGIYNVIYEICETGLTAGPTRNCATATAVVAVSAPGIDAIAESFPSINGSDGGTTVSVLTSDTLNGIPVVPADVALTVDEIRGPSGDVTTAISVDAAGIITVPAGTPAGEYEIEYTICEILNPLNCDSVIETVTVEASAIDAIDDNFSATPIDGVSGGVTPTVFGNDTLNEQTFDPSEVVLTIADLGGLTGLTANPDGTFNVPAGTDAGDYEVTYSICEVLNPLNCDTAIVTISVATQTAISGITFLDENGDEGFQSNEPLVEGTEVRIIDGNGDVVATTTTDSEGGYSVDGLLPGIYDVIFYDPETSVAIGGVMGLEAPAGETVVDQNLPIDPSGVIYDFETSDPIEGAVSVLTDAAGVPLPEVCFIDASQQNQTTGVTGNYRFDLVPGADPACPVTETEYLLEITLPDGLPTIFGFAPEAGSLDATTCPIDTIAGGACQVFADMDAPAPGTPSIFFTSFLLETGDPNVVNNHVPIDLNASTQPLRAVKTSATATASTGTIVPYTITVSNLQTVDVLGADVVDDLPLGFRFVEGSSLVDGLEVAPALDGNRLTWSDIDFPAGASVVVELSVVVGSGVTTGDFVNQAFAQTGLTGLPLSNLATATVRIEPDEVFDCSEVIGKVFNDLDQDGYQDEGEAGIPGARVVTVNGLLITTDQFGRYHIACAATPREGIGSNFILKVDERTLPSGYQVTTENPRVVRLTEGKLTSVDFGVASPRRVRINLTEDAFVAGSVELTSEASATLSEFLEELETEPTILVLEYRGGNGQARLTNVMSEIRTRWPDNAYDLTIETEILTPAEEEEN